MTGIEQLYSREFLAEARDRLTPGGVYCQWFHRYEVNAEAIALVLKTFAAVFDHVAVWSTNRADLMLLGFRDADLALDVERLERRVAARRLPRRAGSPRDRRSADAARARDDSARRPPRGRAARSDPLALSPAAQLRGGQGVLRRAPRRRCRSRAMASPPRSARRTRCCGVISSSRDGATREAIHAEIAQHACYEQLPGCGAFAALWCAAQPELARSSGRSPRRCSSSTARCSCRRMRALREGADRESGAAASGPAPRST